MILQWDESFDIGSDTLTGVNDADYKPALRENSVPTDFVGFVGFWTPCFRHEDSAHDGGRAVFQSGHLRVVQSGSRAADPRAETATHRLQAQVEETDAEKQGSAVLVVAVKDLEGLDIRADPGETRDCDPMEGEEVSGVLAEEVPGQVGQTGNCE